MRKFLLPTLLLYVLFPVVRASAESQNNSVGLGAAFLPYYPGSDRYHFYPVPQASFLNGMMRLDGNDLRFIFPIANNFTIGPVIGYSPGRKSSDVPLLKGLPDIDPTVLYGFFANMKMGEADLSVKYLMSGDNNQGATATVTLLYEILSTPNQRISVSLSGLWNSSDSAEAWYGINASDRASENVRLPEYHPDAGFSQIIPAINWQYNVSNNWSVNSRIGYGLLIGDAKESPLSESNTDVTAMIGLSYKF